MMPRVRALLATLLRRLAEQLCPTPAVPAPALVSHQLAVEMVDAAVVTLLEVGRIAAAAEIETRATRIGVCTCKQCGSASRALRDAARALHSSGAAVVAVQAGGCA